MILGGLLHIALKLSHTHNTTKPLPLVAKTHIPPGLVLPCPCFSQPHSLSSCEHVLTRALGVAHMLLKQGLLLLSVSPLPMLMTPPCQPGLRRECWAMQGSANRCFLLDASKVLYNQFVARWPSPSIPSIISPNTNFPWNLPTQRDLSTAYPRFGSLVFQSSFLTTSPLPINQ